LETVGTSALLAWRVNLTASGVLPRGIELILAVAKQNSEST